MPTTESKSSLEETQAVAIEFLMQLIRQQSSNQESIVGNQSG